MKTDFKGTGPFKNFVADSVTVFNALSNAEVIMPQNYAGNQPTLGIVERDEGGSSLVLNMEDAILITQDNVRFDITTAGVTVENYEVSVSGGQLKVTVSAGAYI